MSETANDDVKTPRAGEATPPAVDESDEASALPVTLPPEFQRPIRPPRSERPKRPPLLWAALAALGVALLVAVVVVLAVLQTPGSDDAPIVEAPEGRVPPPAVKLAPDAGKPAPASTPAAPAGPPKPSFDIVRVSPDGRAVIAGRAAPGAEVTVETQAGTVGKATADKRGEWVIIPDKALAGGSQELRLSAKDQAGKQQADEVVVVSVPLPAAAGSKPVADTPPPLAVLMSRDSHKRLRVLQGPADPAAKQQPMAVEAIDYDDKGQTVMSGRAPADSQIRVYVDNKVVGEAKVDAEGRWELKAANPVGAGDHQVRVDQIDKGGKVLARIALDFAVRAEDTAVAIGGQIIVRPGQSLWRIAQSKLGSGWRYVDLFNANRSKITNPNLIFPGQVLAVPGQQP